MIENGHFFEKSCFIYVDDYIRYLGAYLGLEDPLDVIPDDYEGNYEDDYDPNDVPADQAAPEKLSGKEKIKRYAYLMFSIFILKVR